MTLALSLVSVDSLIELGGMRFESPLAECLLDEPAGVTAFRFDGYDVTNGGSPMD